MIALILSHVSVHFVQVLSPNWSVSVANTFVIFDNNILFKPPLSVGTGGGYMFSGRPSVPLSVRASVRPSVIHVVVLCFRDISSICWRIFAKLLSLVHLGMQMTWLRFWVKRSKFKVTPSWRRCTARRYRWVQLFLVISFYVALHYRLEDGPGGQPDLENWL